VEAEVEAEAEAGAETAEAGAVSAEAAADMAAATWEAELAALKAERLASSAEAQAAASKAAMHAAVAAAAAAQNKLAEIMAANSVKFSLKAEAAEKEATLAKDAAHEADIEWAIEFFRAADEVAVKWSRESEDKFMEKFTLHNDDFCDHIHDEDKSLADVDEYKGGEEIQFKRPSSQLIQYPAMY
jgi:hypothetical protein